MTFFYKEMSQALVLCILHVSQNLENRNLCYFLCGFLTLYELQPSFSMQLQKTHMPHSNSCEIIRHFIMPVRYLRISSNQTLKHKPTTSGYSNHCRLLGLCSGFQFHKEIRPSSFASYMYPQSSDDFLLLCICVSQYP